MDVTFDVKVWKIREKQRPTVKGLAGRTSYQLRWMVRKERFTKTFTTQALAQSYQARLISAQKSGEAFRCSDGLPISLGRGLTEQNWFDLASRYVETKWVRAAAKSRSSIADALASATLGMLSTQRGKPEDRILRRSMTGWAFNIKLRNTPKPPEIEEALRWLSKNTLSVSQLDEPSKVREVLERLALRMDGKPAAANTVNRKRAVFYNLLEFAIEAKALTVNRIPELKWKGPREVRAIDKRVVVNPVQAKKLLVAVKAQRIEGQPRRSAGSNLFAFFGSMYYSALRPEEAAMLGVEDLKLPASGWGEILLSRTAPIAGAAWTDSGDRRDRRGLKHRGNGEVRPVPCPPPLTTLFHEHLLEVGTAADGRLFRNLDGGDLAESTISRVWDRARKAVFTDQEYKSVLAKRPYDLRHACVSTWLAAGVPSTQVAQWAGHSVAILHEIYAKIIAGQESAALAKIDQVLGLDPGHK
jgi:integrase